MTIKSFGLLLVLFGSVLLAGCNDSDSKSKSINTEIFKYSGLMQCEPETRIPVDEMVLELTGAGIDVLCADTAHDGFAYPAVCGAPSGEINLYVIRTANLQDAEVLGFASVDVLPDYQDQPCN